MENVEQSVSDVQSDASSVSADSSPSAGSESQAASPSAEPKQEQYVPYDRFKELVEQKNQFSKRFEDSEKAVRDLQARLETMSKASTPQEKRIHEILAARGVEPEFVKWVEQQEASSKELAELKEFREQSLKQSYLDNARNVVNRLQSELKVDPKMHDLYISSLRNGMSMQEIESAYKQQHDTVSKYMDLQKRAHLAEYSQSKKNDSAVPPPSKGQSSKPAKADSPKNPEDARKQFVKEMAAAMKSSREV